MAGVARIGCSGYLYDGWRGRWYPDDVPKRRWFEYYVERFDTVELNATFYRLPEAATVEKWRDEAPPGFVYASKLGQYATHRKKLKDPDQWLDNALDRADRLGRTRGPILVQLPPRWKRNLERLDEFLARASGHGRRWAVEIRDPDWLHDDTFSLLAEHGAALCVHDLLPDHPFEVTTDWTYVRYHGPDAVERPYVGRYDGRKLRADAERFAGLLDAGCDVYAYFNNDTDADAPVDAVRLRTKIADLSR